jgi:hypothetical protein
MSTLATKPVSSADFRRLGAIYVLFILATVMCGAYFAFVGATELFVLESITSVFFIWAILGLRSGQVQMSRTVIAMTVVMACVMLVFAFVGDEVPIIVVTTKASDVLRKMWLGSPIFGVQSPICRVLIAGYAITTIFVMSRVGCLIPTSNLSI